MVHCTCQSEMQMCHGVEVRKDEEQMSVMGDCGFMKTSQEAGHHAHWFEREDDCSVLMHDRR